MSQSERLPSGADEAGLSKSCVERYRKWIGKSPSRGRGAGFVKLVLLLLALNTFTVFADYVVRSREFCVGSDSAKLRLETWVSRVPFFKKASDGKDATQESAEVRDATEGSSSASTCEAKPKLSALLKSWPPQGDWEALIVVAFSLILLLEYWRKPRQVLSSTATLILGIVAIALASAAFTEMKHPGVALVLFIAAGVTIEFTLRLARLAYSAFQVDETVRRFEKREIRGHSSQFIAYPTQRKVVDEMMRLAGLEQPAGRGAISPVEPVDRGPNGARIIALVGPWGAGKTIICESLSIKAFNSGRAVPVHVNVWSMQHAPSIERAILFRLLTTYEVLRYCWWSVPAIPLFLASSGRAVLAGLNAVARVIGAALGLGLGRGGGEAPAKPLRIESRPVLLNLTQAMQSRGKSLFIVLDDLDRCAPRYAQEVTTLLRRLWDMPGLTIVVPYVSEQLHFKVFDPTNTVLADLSSSAEAYLWDYYASRRDARSSGGDYANLVNSIPERSIIDEHGARVLVRSPAQSGAFAAQETHVNEAHVYRELRRRWVLKQFENASNHVKSYLLQKLASKFLLDNRVRVAPLTSEDIACMLIDSRSFQDLLDMSVTLLEPPEGEREKLSTEQKLAKWRARQKEEIWEGLENLVEGGIQDFLGANRGLVERYEKGIAIDHTRMFWPRDIRGPWSEAFTDVLKSAKRAAFQSFTRADAEHFLELAIRDAFVKLMPAILLARR